MGITGPLGIFVIIFMIEFPILTSGYLEASEGKINYFRLNLKEKAISPRICIIFNSERYGPYDILLGLELRKQSRFFEPITIAILY